MDPSKLKIAQEWPAQDIVFCLEASDEANKIWFGSSDAGVYELDLTTEKPERRRLQGDGHSSYVTGMARIGDVLVTGGYDKRLIWWDLQRGQQQRSVPAHQQWIRRVIATNDGRLVSVADDMRCRVWDLQTGEQLGDFSDHAAQTPHHYPSMLYAVAASSDGGRIATGDRVGHVAIWDAKSFQKLSTLDAPEMYTWDPRQRRHSIGGIRSLAFSPDGTKLAVGGMGQVGNIDHLDGASRLEVFDLASGDRSWLAEDDKNKGLVEQITWSSDGASILIAGGAHKGFVSVYDASTGKQVHTVEHPGHIHAMRLDEPHETIFTGAHQRLARWSTADDNGS